LPSTGLRFLVSKTAQNCSRIRPAREQKSRSAARGPRHFLRSSLDRTAWGAEVVRESRPHEPAHQQEQ
jgi:hypothetical protein